MAQGLDRELSIVYDLLFGYTDKLKVLREEIDPASYSLPLKMAVVFQLRESSWLAGLSSFRRDELYRRLLTSLNKLAGRYTDDVLTARVEEDILVLFVAQIAKPLDFAAYLREELERESGLSLVAGIGKPYDNLQGLLLSFREGLQACRCAIFSGVDLVDSRELNNPASVSIFLSEAENELIQLLKKSNFQGAQEGFSRLLENIINNNFEPDHIKIKLMYLFQKINRVVKGGRSSSPYLARILEVERRDELQQVALSSFTELLTILKKEKQDLKVKQALCFIEEHYNEELSLQLVASKVGLSLYYFSHLFKEEVGESFIVYLNKLRVKKSQQLLKDSSLNIAEISYLVGFNDPNYFSRVFKEYTGLTPSRFRRESL